MLERLKRRLHMTDDASDALLGDLIDDATAFVLNYTGRTSLPNALRGVATEMAAGNYNRLGLEGVVSHSEGGVSDTLELLPPPMRAMLDGFRVARVG